MVYCGSNILGNVVIQYDLESGDWREIPTPLEAFALASFNNQLVLAGGGDSDSIEDSTIRVWDSERGAVVDSSYPPMLAGRGASAAVGYGNYLILACGVFRRSDVEVFDSSSGRWYKAQPVPMGGHTMSSAVVGDCWYLSAYESWEDKEEHIFWTHLPTLTAAAVSS